MWVKLSIIWRRRAASLCSIYVLTKEAFSCDPCDTSSEIHFRYRQFMTIIFLTSFLLWFSLVIFCCTKPPCVKRSDDLPCHHKITSFMNAPRKIYTNIEMRGSVTVRPPWLLIQIKGWNVSKLIKLIKLLKGLRLPTATLRSAADVSEPTFQRFSYKLSGFCLQIQDQKNAML